LPTCLLSTLAGRRRLLCACELEFELPQHLRRLMVTRQDAGVERSLSVLILCIYLRAELHQRLDRLHVPVECRHMQRRLSSRSLRLLVRAELHQHS
jgi:hypothetical protein